MIDVSEWVRRGGGGVWPFPKPKSKSHTHVIKFNAMARISSLNIACFFFHFRFSECGSGGHMRRALSKINIEIVRKCLILIDFAWALNMSISQAVPAGRSQASDSHRAACDRLEVYKSTLIHWLMKHRCFWINRRPYVSSFFLSLRYVVARWTVERGRDGALRAIQRCETANAEFLRKQCKRTHEMKLNNSRN